MNKKSRRVNQSHMKYVSARDEKSQLVPGHYYLYNWVMKYASKSKILDIGCWNGPLELLFEKTSNIVTGIDIESAPLNYAQKRFPKFRFLKADISQKLPFKKNEFDIVLYFMVIEHIPKGKELKSLININRVLKNNSFLFINTMHDTLLSNLLDPAYLFGHRHYKKTQLQSLLEKAGFVIEDTRYNAGFYTTFHMVLLYFFKHILRRKEPRNNFLDMLMKRDYRNKGFAEIDIRARKVRQV